MVEEREVGGFERLHRASVRHAHRAPLGPPIDLIDGNRALSSVAALRNLRTVGGDVTIDDNPELTAVVLPGLHSVGMLELGPLGLSPHVTRIAFDALTTVQTTLSVSLPALQSLVGFDALTTVGGELQLDLPQVPPDEITAFRHRLGR